MLPSRGVNPKTVQNVTKGVRTLEDYLKTTKVSAPKLEGTSALRNNYNTDRFVAGTLFENSLPEEALKVQGHGMAKSPTLQDALARLRYILDNGFEQGKSFYTAPLKVGKDSQGIGSVLGTGGGKPYFDGHFLLTGKPGQMINSADDISTIYINDAYENEEALKAAQKIKAYLQQTYPNKTFKLYSEGFKNGGSIKAANARKWKHQQGGTIGQKINNWFKSDLGKVVTNGVSQLYTGLQENANQVKLNDQLQEWKKSYLKSIQPEDFSTQVNQEEAQIKQSNPDYNSSPLVKQHKQYLLQTQALNRAREKAGMDADQYIQQYMLAQQNNSSSGDIFSGMLKTFLG